MLISDGVDPSSVGDFCKKASRLVLSQVVDHILIQERLIVTGEIRQTEFTVNIFLFQEAEYREEYGIEPWEILASFGVNFPLLLKKEIASELKKLDANLKRQIAELGKGKKVTNGSHGKDGSEEEGDEMDAEIPSKSKNDDGESEAGDGDAEDAKRVRQKQEQATYEDDEEEPEYFDDDVEAVDESANQTFEEPQPKKNPKASDGSLQVAKIAQIFEGNFPLGEDFTFDARACTFRVIVRSFAARSSY
jgi:DNA-directed RNA polymerase I subunit RPA1